MVDQLQTPSPGHADPLSHPAPSRQEAPTIPALDGFRAIAIVIVLLSHVGLDKVVPGRFGVTLFFVLSGYLITTLLRREWLRTGTISFRAFYLRRSVRILPPMYLAIALAVAFSYFGLIHPLNPDGLVFDLVFLTNYFDFSGIPIGLWSLAVEEHFYLLFPALAVLMLRRGSTGGFALLCLALCFVGLIVRVIEADRLPSLVPINFWSHTRMDSILFGAILALWNNPVIDTEDRLPSRWASYLIGGALLAVTFIIRDEVFRQTLRYTLQGLALILIFNAAIRDKLAHRVLDIAPLKLTALLSYTLYLVHGIFVAASDPLAAIVGTPLAHAGAIALSFVFAFFVHIAMERPLAQWRRGIEHRWRARDAERPRDMSLIESNG